MSPVKDQGSCAASWAFAVTGALEWKSKKEGKNLIFSEQSLVDCGTNNAGCRGGYPPAGFWYVVNKGIALESDYPYVEVAQECQPYDPQTVMSNMALGDSTVITEDMLKFVLLKFGPLAILVSLLDDFFYYESGVYSNPFCFSEVSQGLVVVGFGTDPVQGDYWIVRNSWGTSWGQNGYGKMARNQGNQCGITYTISAPCN